jgi:hypothetical protein
LLLGLPTHFGGPCCCVTVPRPALQLLGLVQAHEVHGPDSPLGSLEAYLSVKVPQMSLLNLCNPRLFRQFM